MKRLLLLGTLLAVASFATGCMTCGGYGVCGVTPMSCYSPCDPCGGGYVAACPAKYVSPYAGQYYSGDECGMPCGGCGGCGEGYHPFARLCNLFSMGGGNCGCACEKYYGDYINNPPSMCNPCDQFGGLAGFSAKCSDGMCDSCSSPMSYSPVSYGSMPYAPVSQPMVQPAMMMSPMSSPSSECKTCNQGNTFYTGQQVRPQPRVQPTPLQQTPMIARNQVPMQQPVIIAQSRQAYAPQPIRQPVMQDKLVTAGSQQQINYNMYPVRQVAVRANEQFGSTNKVIQPATIPTNGRVVHAK